MDHDFDTMAACCCCCVRVKVRKRYKNLEFSPPYQHAMFATRCCVEVPKWSNEDKLASIEGKNTLLRDAGVGQ